MGRNESANAGPIGAQFSSSKGLDFRCKRSVSVGMSMRASGPIWDPALLAMSPMWGFGGDGV
jgi:hypothetical protein